MPKSKHIHKCIMIMLAAAMLPGSRPAEPGTEFRFSEPGTEFRSMESGAEARFAKAGTRIQFKNSGMRGKTYSAKTAGMRTVLKPEPEKTDDTSEESCDRDETPPEITEIFFQSGGQNYKSEAGPEAAAGYRHFFPEAAWCTIIITDAGAQQESKDDTESTIDGKGDERGSGADVENTADTENTTESRHRCESRTFVKLTFQDAGGGGEERLEEALLQAEIKATENDDKVCRKYMLQFGLPDVFRGRIEAEPYDCCGNHGTPVYTEGFVTGNGEDAGIPGSISAVPAVPADGINEQGEEIYINDTIPVTVTLENYFSGIGSVGMETAGASFYSGADPEAEIPLNQDKNLRPGSSCSGWEILETDENLITKMKGTVYLRAEQNEVSVKFGFYDRSGRLTGIRELQFYIDGEAPATEVFFDLNEPENEKYYNAARTAEIRVHENNFDRERSIIKARGTEGTPVIIEDWLLKGVDDAGKKIYSCRVKFSEDDEYSLKIDITDAAGNTCRQIRYAPGTRDPENFVIDTKIDQLEISGLKDGGIYAGSMTGTIRINDLHPAESRISIYRTGSDEKTENVTSEFLTDNNMSGRASFLHFTGGEEADGRYRLLVEARDLAGNREEEKLDFVIDRFGSKFRTGGGFGGIKNNFVRSVDEDLLFYEINPAGIRQGTGEAEIVRGGQSITDARYEVREISPESASGSDPEENGDRALPMSGWHSYAYVISKENFRKDGVYRVSVSSEDLAGNYSSSLRNLADPMFFCVDGTAPLLQSITGSEKKEVDDGKITFSAFDAFGLSYVKVFADEKEVLCKERFRDNIHYTDSLKLEEGKHHIRFVLSDQAGNVLDTDEKDINGNYIWKPPFSFCRDVLVTKNEGGILSGALQLPEGIPFSSPFSGRTKGTIGREGENTLPGQIPSVLSVIAMVVPAAAGVALGGRKRFGKKKKHDVQKGEGI